MRFESAKALWTLLAVTVGAPALAVGAFWALASQPERVSCGAVESAAHRAAFADWVTAAQVAHIGAAWTVLAVIVLASSARSALRGGEGASRRTKIATAAVAALVAVAPFAPVVLAPWLLVVFVVLAVSSSIGTAGGVIAAVIAALLVAWMAVAAWRPGGSQSARRRWLLGLQCLGWAIVLVVVPASFEIAYAFGGRPLFC
jgi:hypothetical protein